MEAAGRRLGAGAHSYGDLSAGDWFLTPPVTLEAEHIDRFAALSGDVFEIHMSDEAAQAHGFRARVAHGLLVLALSDGLKNQAEAKFKAIASLGWDWSFRRPVYIGDTIKVRISIAEMRETKRADRGIVRLNLDVTNQHGEVVQTGSNLLMVSR